MNIALTGVTGFLGRYIAHHLHNQGHTLRCWYRPESNRQGLNLERLTWVPGQLDSTADTIQLLDGCNALVHCGLYHSDGRFRGGEGDLVQFVQTNLVGSMRLFEKAHQKNLDRVVFISSCAVHERILDDRALDENHPLWPRSHYGAHKAALEKFVHSYGLGRGYPISALRPTGIYGTAHPPTLSKWYDLVAAVVQSQPVSCNQGGKEVHATDVARAVGLLLGANNIAGEVFNCYDRYISAYEVATIAQRLSGSHGTIHGTITVPKNQIIVDKLAAMGMTYGGSELLEASIGELVAVAQHDH